MQRGLQRHFFLFLLIFMPILVWGQNGTIKGRVRDNNGNPLDSIKVEVKALKLSVLTDEKGAYELSLPPGKHALEFSNPDFKPATEQITVVALKSENLYVNLGERYMIGIVKINDNHDPTGIGDPNNPDTQRLPIKPKYMTTMPGFKSDLSSRLQTMALGVNINNELSSQYRVRGGNFDENLVYVNDIEVYRPFLVRTGQQEGLGFVNPNLASDVGFSSGGFQAKYGDKLSSVLDVTYTDPDKLHGSAELGILNQNFNIEGSVQKASSVVKNPNSDEGAKLEMVPGRFTYLFGARRFTPSYVLSSLDTKGEYKPRFADVQGMFTFAPKHKLKNYRVRELGNGITDTVYYNKERIKFSLFYNFADNQYIFTPVSRETSFGTVQNVLRLRVGFQGQDISGYTTSFGAFTVEHRPNTRLKMKYIFSGFRTVESELFEVEGGYYLSDVNTNFGSEDYNTTVFDRGIGTFYRHGRNYLQGTVLAAEQRGDWFPGRTYRHKISWGARVQHQLINDEVREWTGNDSAGYFELEETYRNNKTVSSNLYKVYLQDYWKLSKDNTKRLIVGVRGVYNDLNGQFLIAPRLQFVIDPSSAATTAAPMDESQYARGDKRRYQLRFAIGAYNQPIFYREMRAFDGELNLNRKAQNSYHAIAGGDYLFNIWGRPFKFSAEGYYKYMTDLVPYEIENVRVRYYPFNHANGYAVGIDSRVTGQFIKGVDSWMSFGVLRTKERILELTQGYVPRPTDQRFQFSMFFQDELPINPNYKAHINFVYGSGLRFGPPRVIANRTVFQYPSYQRVDMGFSRVILINSIEKREEKKFSIETLWISFEIYNLFQRANTVSYVWIKDVYNNQFGVPNYLSARLLNLRVIARF